METGRPGRGTRPDASMSLLDAITGTALDPGYARAARARRGAARGRRARLATFVVLLVPGLLLAVAVVDAQRGAPALARQHKRLVATIKERGHAIDQARRQAAGLRADITGLRHAALARSRSGRAAQRRLDAAARAAAAAPDTGDGIRITVNDAPARGGAPAARVYDRDLQNLVNGLWAAGATAVAVNGRRITSTSAIREAGSSILVAFHPISPPYRIDAVGDPGTVQPRLAESPAGRRLQTLANTYGIRYDVTTAEDLRLPAGSATVRYARTAPQ